MNDLKVPKFYRQRLVLALLAQSGGRLSKMDFQKLLFLLHKEAGFQYYGFVPYQYGCYSFQAAEDVGILERLGWVKTGPKEIVLEQSAGSYSLLSNEQALLLKQFSDSHKHLRGRTLVKYIYERHPYYAIYSEMADDLLDDKFLQEIDERRPRTKGTTLYTIGYEGISFEDYLNKLIKNNVRLLCDVRKNSASRKFGFSKGTLSIILPKFGISYVHIPALGIESVKRATLESKADYDALFEEYSATLPVKEFLIADVQELLKKYRSIALTCFEADPEMCHRHCISDYIEADGKLQVTHL